MYKAVFFDFWGTLVENGTYSPLRQSYKILQSRMPFGQFAEQFERVIWTKPFEDQTQGFIEVCKSFGVDPKPFIIDRLVGVWNKNKLLAKVYPDTLETLNAIKDLGVKIILISNCPKDSIEPVLDRFGITELLDAKYLSYVEGTLKHERLFEVALEKSGLDPSEVLGVGDSMETDIKGSNRAGIRAVLIDRRGKREFENKVSSLKELLRFIEE